MATRYLIDIKHEALGRFRRISGPDSMVVEEKARLQLARWNEQWQRIQATDYRQKARERAKQDLQEKKEQAVEETREAREALQALEGILAHTLKVDDRINWTAMKDRSPFPKDKPQQPSALLPPAPSTQPTGGIVPAGAVLP